MPAPTDNPYEWSTNAGTRVEPSATEKGTGAVPGQPMGSGVFNHVVGVVSAWVTYLKSIGAHFFDSEHDPANGTHTDITLDDALLTHTSTKGYRYNSALTKRIMVSPFSALQLWRQVTSTVSPNLGSPSYIQPADANPAQIELHLAPWLAISDDHTGSGITFVKMEFWANLVAASDSIACSLFRQIADGSSAAAEIVGPDSFVGATSGFALQTWSPAHTFVKGYDYWIKVVLDANSAAADVKMGSTELFFDKTRVE